MIYYLWLDYIIWHIIQSLFLSYWSSTVDDDTLNNFDVSYCKVFRIRSCFMEFHLV